MCDGLTMLLVKKGIPHKCVSHHHDHGHSSMRWPVIVLIVVLHRTENQGVNKQDVDVFIVQNTARKIQ